MTKKVESSAETPEEKEKHRQETKGNKERKKEKEEKKDKDKAVDTVTEAEKKIGIPVFDWGGFGASQPGVPPIPSGTKGIPPVPPLLLSPDGIATSAHALGA
jgi:hypothetical protein